MRMFPQNVEIMLHERQVWKQTLVFKLKSAHNAQLYEITPHIHHIIFIYSLTLDLNQPA